MAIFVTGDVHGGAEYGSSRFSSKSWPDGRTLSRDDVVVVAGDFGFVWDGSNTDRRLLPMAGHVHDPVPAGRLLLIMPLVLAGGV